MSNYTPNEGPQQTPHPDQTNVDNYRQPNGQVGYPQQHPVAPYNQVPGYPGAQVGPVESVGQWMLTLFIAGIPLIGFVYLLVLAFGSSVSQNKQNFARALLLLQVIAFALVILFSIITGAFSASLFYNIE